ncbi:Na+/H+ antiporter NhaA, partial [Tistlia consotensis]
IFLLALAIIDDLGAIVIIALFYTSDLSVISLALAGLGIALMVLLNLRGVSRLAPYILLGIVIWVCVLKSGVHATLAGVAVALCIPIRARDLDGEQREPLGHLEHALHPWVAFCIMPLFAFGNAGISFAGMSFESFLEPVPLGIALGLFLGKQVGVFTFAWLAVKTGLSRLPQAVSWGQFYGVAILTGIGFTMSLFVGTLAFDDPQHGVGVRLGVLSGSLCAAVVGYLLVKSASAGRPVEADAA